MAAALLLSACASNTSHHKPDAGGGGAAGSAGNGFGNPSADASFTTGEDAGGMTVGGGTPPPAPCSGLACQQTTCVTGECKAKACTTGKSTNVSGTVYDPAGKLPLYNVLVFVPNGTLSKIESGASCDRCNLVKEKPLVSALTDTHGHFLLKNVPVGEDIPLVMQIGKWRRQVSISTVKACTETKLTDKNLTRLPRNKKEGNIPLIAITTGGADSMECLPRRLGIDDAEFTTDKGTGRIHLYSGHDNGTDTATAAFDASLNKGATLTRSTALWNTVTALKKYDLVILSCEGDPIESEKPASARKALYEYAKIGGRVFASHWQRIWFSDGPDPVPKSGMWSDRDNPPNP
ncbi:MAG TPA: carboxypeptidase regulatory-like domain-containing protein, partial [Polyangiales bacterium]|nr:carboxypeptidase regulatory-like domain-containing protein [Polyangiales bacterium]